jgi:prophage tail gpP-like protein
MTARAETDIGDPFPHFSIDTGETVMSAIEKAARQRGVLVVSDGVGGIVLTETGATRAGAPLIAIQHDGGVDRRNIHRTRLHMSWRGRFSDHYIKGQLPHVRSAKTAARAALDVTVTPLGTGAALPPPPAVTGATPTKHKRGKGKHGPVYQTGHATDPGVTRYRPKVWMTRAEAGLDTVDEQADWRARLTAAQAAGTYYTMVGHRPAAPGGKTLPLWMPNTLAAVTDPIRGLDGVDQLIAGVTYLDGEDGARTVLRVVDPASYALDEELVGAKRAGRSRPRHQKAVDATSRRYR